MYTSVYHVGMIKSGVLPIRLDEDTIARIDCIASASGLNNRSAIIKVALHLMLPKMETGVIRFGALKKTSDQLYCQNRRRS